MRLKLFNVLLRIVSLDMTSSKSRGFVIISTVFILLAVAIAIGATTTLLSVSDAQTSFALSEGVRARGLLDGCVEDVLLFSRANATYTGGALSRPGGTCLANIAKLGNRWTATVRANGEYVQAAEVVFDRTASGVNLLQWRAVE